MIFGFSQFFINIFIAALLLAGSTSLVALGQTVRSIPYKSQEVSEIDGIPVLIKHLPEWENVYDQTTFAKDVGQLKEVLGERSILDLIDFSAGTEAVTAPYESGRLLLIEYSSPQGSVDADNKFLAALTETRDNSTFYRRIGNYNVFVFDAEGESAANDLIDKVAYEKHIVWLGDNPFRISAERVFILTTADIFTSTVLVIVMGIGLSIIGGLIVGSVFFVFRNSKRTQMSAYTDAGGMTRLNLDGFTPDIGPDLYLKD
ncbi:MAG: hypothetical protein ABIV48_01965 [Pyrinomonadaceae bacterium]